MSKELYEGLGCFLIFLYKPSYSKQDAAHANTDPEQNAEGHLSEPDLETWQV